LHFLGYLEVQRIKFTLVNLILVNKTVQRERKRNSSLENVVIRLKMFKTSTISTEDIKNNLLVAEYSVSTLTFVKTLIASRVKNTDISNDKKC